MPELASSVLPKLGGEGGSQAGAPAAAAEPTPEGAVEYVTPPPKRVITVAVRYSEARKGVPMPYDLAAADEEP